MSQTPALPAPRKLRGPALTLAGHSEHYTYSRVGEIPAQWQRFAPLIGNIPGQVGAVTYGVCIGDKDNRGFDYLAAVAVANAIDVAANLTVLRLPARPYAVFLHVDNVATLRTTLTQIWQQWAPQCSEGVDKAPFFERYDESFNPATGDGGVEIWVPLKA